MTATERNEHHRIAFLEKIKNIDPKRLVFLDETGTHLGFTRLFARALRGERAVGSVPRNRGKTLSLISTMSLEGIKADFVVEGGVSGDVFVTYVRKVLLKCLKPGQVVVMDNLAAHHQREVIELIEGIGCEVLFLPSYSPDFNPSDHARQVRFMVKN